MRPHDRPGRLYPPGFPNQKTVRVQRRIPRGFHDDFRRHGVPLCHRPDRAPAGCRAQRMDRSARHSLRRHRRLRLAACRCATGTRAKHKRYAGGIDHRQISRHRTRADRNRGVGPADGTRHHRGARRQPPLVQWPRAQALLYGRCRHGLRRSNRRGHARRFHRRAEACASQQCGAPLARRRTWRADSDVARSAAPPHRGRFRLQVARCQRPATPRGGAGTRNNRLDPQGARRGPRRHLSQRFRGGGGQPAGEHRDPEKPW